MSSARCIAAFRTNSEVCSWTRLAARWMRSRVAWSARSSMRFVLTATATPPSCLSHRCSQLSITSLYGECTYTASKRCGPHWGPSRDHTSCAMPNDLHVSERHIPRPGGENRRRPEKTRYRYFLGVKWSQVQILSARRCQPDQTSSRSEAVSEKSGVAFPVLGGGMYSNEYSNDGSVDES